MAKIICVTGGAGFIGSHLCANLIAQGNYVLCIDYNNPSYLNSLKELIENDHFTYQSCDIRDASKLTSLLRENSVDTLYHYAALVGVKRTIERPVEVLDINGLATKNVLEAALQSRVSEVIFASTSEVYGNATTLPENEEGITNPKLPYAVAKYFSEKYFESYSKMGLKSLILRLFNVYGPGQDASDYGFVVGIFIKRILERQRPIIFGDGKQTRDFVFIEDNVNATMAAAEKINDLNGEVINIGTGHATTIFDLAQLISKLSGNDSIEPIFSSERTDYVRHRLAENSKLTRIVGFRFKYTLAQGIEKTIQWYRNKNVTGKGF